VGEEIMAYQRATIMDAFNAVNHFGQQALGYMDSYNREKADAFMRNIPADFHVDMQNQMRDDPYNYTGDPDNEEELKKYTNDYIAKMDGYAEKWYGDKFGGKGGIGYYARAKEQMLAQAKTSTRNKALEKQDEWRVQRAYINFDEKGRKIIEGVKNGDFTLDKGVEAIHNHIEYLGTQDEISAHKKNKMRTSYETAVYQEYASSVLGQIHDVKDLEEGMKRVRAAAANLPKVKINTYDEKGNVTGTLTYKTTDKDGNEIETEEHPWGFDGKDEWEKKLIQQETNRIHERNKNEILEKNAVYNALMDRAARGETTAYWEAQRIAEPYRKGIQKQLREGEGGELIEYADNFHDRIPGLFDDGTAGGRGSGGARKKKDFQDKFDLYAQETYKAYFNGETQFQNGREVLAAVRETLYEMYKEEYGIEDDEEAREAADAEFTDYFFGMEDAFMKVAKSDGLRAMIPQAFNDYKRMRAEDKKLQNVLNKEYGDRLEQVNKYLDEEFFDYMTSLYRQSEYGVKPEDIQKGLKEILGRFYSKKMAVIGQAAAKDKFGALLPKEREKALAEALDALSESPGAISTRRNLKNPVYMPGPDSNPDLYKEGLHAIGTEAMRQVARSQLPSKATEADIQKWMAKARVVNEIDVDRDEENPAAIVQYGDQGIYFKVTAEKNDKGKLTGKIRVDKQVTAGKTPDAIKEDKGRPQNVNRTGVEEGTIFTEREERKRKEQEINDKYTGTTSLYEIVQKIDDGIDPNTGEKVDFDFRETPPPYSKLHPKGYPRNYLESYKRSGDANKRREWRDYYHMKALKDLGGVK
jgi:hypothetical protein